MTQVRQDLVTDQRNEMAKAEQEGDDARFHPSKALLELDRQITCLSDAQQYKQADLLHTEYTQIVCFISSSP